MFTTPVLSYRGRTPSFLPTVVEPPEQGLGVFQPCPCPAEPLPLFLRRFLLFAQGFVFPVPYPGASEGWGASGCLDFRE